MGLKEYLKNGSAQSSMRLIFVLTGITACIISAAAITFNFVLLYFEKGQVDLLQVAALVGVLLGAVTLGKVQQAKTEAGTSKAKEGGDAQPAQEDSR